MIRIGTVGSGGIVLRVTLVLFAALFVACAGPSDATPPSATTPAASAVQVATPTAAATSQAAAASPSAAPACDGRVTFEFPPVDLDATEMIVPLGLMYGSHVTPVDHIYFQNNTRPDLDIDVYSPAAGTVIDIQRMSTTLADDGGDPIDDFRLVIEHTCSLSSIFIHVDDLAPALAAVAPPLGQSARVSVAVQAGELIGSYRGNVDYNLVDLDVTLPGLLVPASYSQEPWKVHAVPPFAYFTDAIQQQLNARSLRAVAPFDGRFDNDIDGRLVGNWFQQGTNGYAGASRERYWAGHLAVAYDHFDPSHVVVSLGTFDGASVQFAVRGNTPDPAEVSVASGLVVYELVEYDYWAGSERWDRRSYVPNIEARNMQGGVRGVVLFQLLEERVLKVESFPGKTAAQVSGFTAAALLYER